MSTGPAILRVIPSSRFELVTQQALPFVTRPVAFYRPVAEEGVVFFGDRVQNSAYGAYGSAITAREEGSDSGGPLLVAPTGFTKVWQGEGFAVWAPLAPDGYLPLGSIVAAGDRTPAAVPGLGCVRWDQVTRVPMGDLVWESAGPDAWVSLYAVDPIGTFYAQPTASIDFPDPNAYRLRPYGSAFGLVVLA